MSAQLKLKSFVDCLLLNRLPTSGSASVNTTKNFKSGAEHTVVDPSGDDLVMSNRDVGRGVHTPP